MEGIPNLKNTKEVIKSFDELHRIIGRNLSEDQIEVSADQEESMLERADQRDQYVESADILDVLEEYGYSIEGLNEYAPDRFEISVSANDLPVELPHGYGLKGGGARYVLESTLGINALTPRDLDIIRISRDNSSSSKDYELAERYMYDDLLHGHGVEVIDDEEVYFASRDLTMNEVMTNGTKLRFTKQCLLDIVRRIIRPTEYVKDCDGGVGVNMLAKMIRFYSENIRSYNESHDLDSSVVYQLEGAFIPPFWLALNLDKAWERGREFAVKYCREINKRGFVPEDIVEPDDVLEYLSERVWNFYFRNAEKSQFTTEDQWIESIQDKLERRISRRSIRA